MDSLNISWLDLFFASLVLVIPIAILYYYRTGLVRATLFSFSRMAIQLTLVGFYLQYIFDYNELWLNLLWVIIMIFAAAFTVVKRSELLQNKFYIPVLIGIIMNILINVVLIAVVVIGSEHFFNARYIIPITGMFIGNSLNSAIIGLRSFYKSLINDEEKYKYYLMCGAEKNEALFPFISEALKDALSPTIASTATIGLIWLPGMMTGQILGGSDPITSIKYQIMIIVGIFSGTAITVFISLITSKKFAFNDYDIFDRNIFVGKSNGNDANSRV